MNTPLCRCAVVVLVVTLCVVGAVTRGQADVQPGDTITRENMAQAEALLTPGTRWMVYQGMPMQVIETKKVHWPRAHKEATEQYAGQVQLSPDGLELRNYVAGCPFPNVDPNDPLAGFCVLAKKDVLAVAHSGKYGDPSTWCGPRDGKHGMLAGLPCVSWETRGVSVIEGTPTSYPRTYAYSKRILYIDQDFFGPGLQDIYDQRGELWKSMLNCGYYTTKPYDGYPTKRLSGARYNYTDEWLFVPNFVFLDVQKGLATAGEAPPGSRQPSEWKTEWYFNEPVSGNAPDVFSPSALSRGTR